MSLGISLESKGFGVSKMGQSLVIFVMVILPSLLLVLGIILYSRFGLVRSEPDTSWPDEVGAFLEPSVILEDKYQYKDRELTLRGQIRLGQIVCNRQDCPENDSCCGCPIKRDLILADSEEVVGRKTKWQLRLLDPKRNALCHRLVDSCDYQCPGWEMGSIYEVRGVFYADPPPKGSSWQLFMDFYFVTEEAYLIKKVRFFDKVENLLGELVGWLGSLKTSGSYVTN